MRNAWVSFGCSTTGRDLLAVFENVRGSWELASVRESSAGGGTPGKVRLSAPFGISPGYAGCCACGSDSFVRCGDCGRLACWRSTERWFTCPSCRTSGEVSGSIEIVDAADAT